MKNDLKINAKKEARQEGRIFMESLREEIAVLLKEHYIATVRTAENTIVMQFPNGQQAILAVHI